MGYLEADAVLSKDLGAKYRAGTFKFEPVPDGAELSEGERYIVYMYWPRWLTEQTGKLMPAVAELRGDLDRLGLDAYILSAGSDALLVFAEPKRAGIRVRDVWQLAAGRGGLCAVTYAGDFYLGPEIGVDVLETFQSMRDTVERTDVADALKGIGWWTASVAKWSLVAVVVIAAIALAVVLLRRRAAK